MEGPRGGARARAGKAFGEAGRTGTHAPARSAGDGFAGDGGSEVAGEGGVVGPAEDAPRERAQARAGKAFGEAHGPVRLLFVCLGNICRSPTAEGVMRSLVHRDGLDDAFVIDSAGTGAWHVGSSPDRRATSAAASRGIPLEGAARQVAADDFERFDLLLAMDGSNLAELRRLAPNEEARRRAHLLREFDPACSSADDPEVPDPYYGGPHGFEDVLDQVSAACEGLLEAIREGRVP